MLIAQYIVDPRLDATRIDGKPVLKKVSLRLDPGAAFKPGTPETPPPGWEPAPHRNRPSIGVS